MGVASSVTPSKLQNKPDSPSEYKQELENELEEKQKVIERLQTEVQDLAKRADRAGSEKQSTYVEFLENRLKET